MKFFIFLIIFIYLLCIGALHGGSRKMMDEGDRIKGRILQELRSNPKGLTVSEVSRKIGLNRNSTAKYLDILRINGRIDMRPLGRAKMFYISQRVPISALLNFSTDYILVLDASMRIVETNENFLKFFKVKKEMLLDVPLFSANLPILTTKESLKKIKKAIEGKDSTFEMEIVMEEGVRYFKGKLIPSTLGDGGNGVTIIMENITEQKMAQNRLKESEERYRDLIENQGEGVGLTDPRDVFTFANPAAERLMGVGPGKLVGRSVMDFLPSNQVGKVLHHNERRKKGGKDTYQVEIVADDGKKKTILLTATPRYDDDGNFIGSFGVFRDITLMKESERKLAESEQRYRLLFEFTSDTIMILKGRKIIDCNNSTLSMFGYDSKEDIIGLDPKDLSPPEQQGGEKTDLEVGKKINGAREKGLITFNWIHRKKDGTDFLADIQLQSIRIGGESLFQARMRDITDLVEAKNELQEKEAKLNNILTSLHGSFIGLLNKDLIFEDFWGTEDLDEKYGIKGKRLKGMSILDFTHDDYKDDILKSLKKMFETGIPYRMEHRAVLPSGRFWQDWSFSPFKTGKKEIEYLVQFGRDTQEKNDMVQALVNVKKREMEELRIKDRILESITTVSSIMLKKGNWRDKIIEALGNLGRSVDVSRVYIFRNMRDPEKGILTSQIIEWTEEGIESQMDNPDLKDFPLEKGFKRWTEVMSGGEVIKGIVDEFPPEEKKILKDQRIISIAVVPIMIEGKWWGFIGFDDCRKPRNWYSEEIKALRLAGSMLGAVVTGHGI